VTDTQESTIDSGATQPAGGAADSARAAAKRRSGSLSTMLLPDLQQLAGSLGIAPGKLKKSDLVVAIQSAQTGANGSSATGFQPQGSNAFAFGLAQRLGLHQRRRRVQRLRQWLGLHP